MFLANFIFVVSHLNTSEAMTSLAFIIVMFQLVLKKDKMVADCLDV